MNKKIRGLEKDTQIKKGKQHYKPGESCKKYAAGGIAKSSKPSMQRRCK